MRKLLSLSVFAFCLTSQAASITAVGTRAGLGANDLVEWGVAGDDGSSVASPYARISTNGLTATASLTTGFTIWLQNGTAYAANFTPNEIVLETSFLDGPITVAFSAPIRGLGFNIAHLTFGAFNATLDFYNAGNTLMGSVNVNGDSNTNSDGSAVFLGGQSDLRDISSIVISVGASGGSKGFAINQMSLLTTDPPVSGVPEPSSIVLVSTAVLALGIKRARR